MKQAIKITVLVMLFSAVIVGSIYGFRWYRGQQTAAAPIATEGQEVLTTNPDSRGTTLAVEDEKDDLKSDAEVTGKVAWPFADSKSDSKFEAKESVGYTKPAASSKQTEKTTSKDTADKTKASSEKETTKASSDASNTKALLKKIESTASSKKNGHPVKVDSNGVSIEYQKFAVADLNDDGKDEVFLYAVGTKDGQFNGYYYIVYDSTLKNVRTTMVIDEFKDVTFYKSGVYEITDGKFAFISDEVAASFGVKNENSIIGYDTTTTPYLRYTTNGPYIANPSEVSESEYKAAVSKLKAGGKVDVTVYDFTSANIEKL